MNTNQILISQYINSLGSINQWIISSKNNKTIIVNLYSLDQFLPFRFIQSNHGKLFQQFKLRHLYTLPHTPKIILLPNILKPNQQILLLAQRGQFQFHKLIVKCHGNYKMQLELILQVLQTVSMLQKKYGYFKLTQGMIRASKGPSLLIWINEDQTINYPQFPIGPLYPVNLQKVGQKNLKRDKIKDNQMYMMVMSILKILSQKLPNNPLIAQLIKEKQQNINFQSIKKKLLISMKIQYSQQYSTQSNLSIQKYKTFTEQKKKKIPQFLINKGNFSHSKKDKQKNIQDLANKKSAINFFNHQNTQYKPSIQWTHKKQIDKKLIKDKPDKLKYFFNKKIINKSKIIPVQQNQDSIPLNHHYQPQHFIKTYPINSPKQNTSKYKDQKPLVRDSGKTSSTTSAHYLSVNSSGQKFLQNNFSIDLESSSETSIPIKAIQTTYIQNNDQNQQQVKSIFYKQNTNRLQVKISKIIEQNHEQRTQSNIKSSKINNLANNKSSISLTQNSFIGGNSQFYHDVDILLHSAVLSQNHITDQDLDKNLQKQLQQILFD